MITDKVGGSSAKPEVSKQSKEKRLKHKVSGYKSQSKRWSIAGCRLLLRTLILDEKEFRQGIFYIHCSRHIGLVPKGLPRHAFSQKSLFLGKTARKKKGFLMFYIEKKPNYLLSHQIGFLQKRLPHALSKKFEISCLFVLCFFLVGICIKHFLMF